MSLTVDYTTFPYLITVPKADLTLVTGTRYELDVDVFWALLRDYADSSEGIVHPVIYRRVAATSSTPSITEVNAGYYVIQFEDGLYSVNVINGNTNIRDVEVKNQVSVNTNNTTGFIDPKFLEIATFIGKQGAGVTIDPLNGTDGTVYPIGTRGTPCKTEANFEAISLERGFVNVYVITDITLMSDHSVHRHIFFGDNALTVNIHCDVLSDVTSCEFRDAHISGSLGTNNIFRDCLIGAVTNANSFIYNCTIVGPVVLASDTSLEECWRSPTAPGDEVIIDFNNLPVTCLMSDWSAGAIRVKNMVTGSLLSVTGPGGIIRIDSATAGGVAVWGGSIQVDPTNSELLDTFQDSSVPGQVWTDIRGLTVGKYLGLK